ncbi:MAG: GtrA family protein [Candidatus Eremiobacteraeota bacterium]|nr:GtrA family protein [Candidatus Eremiobacteraeota bacterium]
MSERKKLVLRRGVRQFLKFGVVGASGTLVNLALYHLLLYVGTVLWLAYAVGFILGGVNNYWWNRHWTFRSQGHPWKELGQFITVSAIALGLSEVVLIVAERHIPAGIPLRNSAIWLLATVCGMGWNFFGNKFWTFRHTHQPAIDQRT